MNGPIKKEWLTRKEASAHLMALGYFIAPRTLARMAGDGQGPPYRRTLYKITAYNREALERWAAENTTEINSDNPAPAKGGALSAASFR